MNKITSIDDINALIAALKKPANGLLSASDKSKINETITI